MSTAQQPPLAMSDELKEAALGYVLAIQFLDSARIALEKHGYSTPEAQAMTPLGLETLRDALAAERRFVRALGEWKGTVRVAVGPVVLATRFHRRHGHAVSIKIAPRGYGPA